MVNDKPLENLQMGQVYGFTLQNKPMNSEIDQVVGTKTGIVAGFSVSRPDLLDLRSTLHHFLIATPLMIATLA